MWVIGSIGTRAATGAMQIVVIFDVDVRRRRDVSKVHCIGIVASRAILFYQLAVLCMQLDISTSIDKEASSKRMLIS